LSYCEFHFKSYFNRGFAKDKLHLYIEAITDYSMAIKIDPNNPFAYYNRGISFDRLKKYKEAISDFSKAISLNDKKADFYY